MPTASMMIVVMEALPKPSPSWLLALPASQQHHFSRLWATKRLSTHRKQGAFLLRPRSVREALVNGDVTKVSPPLLEEKSQKLNYDDPDQWTTLPDIWKSISTKYGDAIALVDPHHEPHTELTFKQLEKQILKFAEGLRQTGVSSSDKIALFADNSYRWLIADQGIMSIGAIDVVRGSRSSINELAFIYSHSDSVALVVDNVDLCQKLIQALNASSKIKFIVVLWGEKSLPVKELVGANVPLYTFQEILKMGEARTESSSVDQSAQTCKFKEIQPDDVATIVYTSGTTGSPKGVMLTHANLLHQVVHLWEVVQPSPGDRFLSLLPPWHMYERSVEYFSLARGSEQVYTNIKSLKEDLRRYPPHYMVSVPLVFDTLYSGIQKELSSSSPIKKLIASALIQISMTYFNLKRIHRGKELDYSTHSMEPSRAAVVWLCAGIGSLILLPLHRLAQLLVYRKILSVIGIKKAGISGGGSLASHIDKFFEAIGMTLLNGYGLTESSPVIASRNAENNVLGTVGKALGKTEVKIVDVHSGETLSAGKKGIIKIRGPQVMNGYYKNTDATRKAIDEGGWLDTGDLGWILPERITGPACLCGGNLVLDGRLKDTIVLSTGENIEPTVIEEAAMQSKFIQQIVVVGQDQRRLGALIVVNKDEMKLAGLSDAAANIQDSSHQNLKALIQRELQKYTSNCPTMIGPFILLDESFTTDNGMLTPTMKVRRDMVSSKYQKEISALFRSANSKA